MLFHNHFSHNQFKKEKICTFVDIKTSNIIYDQQ